MTYIGGACRPILFTECLSNIMKDLSVCKSMMSIQNRSYHGSSTAKKTRHNPERLNFVKCLSDTSYSTCCRKGLTNHSNDTGLNHIHLKKYFESSLSIKLLLKTRKL